MLSRVQRAAVHTKLPVTSISRCVLDVLYGLNMRGSCWQWTMRQLLNGQPSSSGPYLGLGGQPLQRWGALKQRRHDIQL
jgi:hypothetical protein